MIWSATPLKLNILIKGIITIFGTKNPKSKFIKFLEIILISFVTDKMFITQSKRVQSILKARKYNMIKKVINKIRSKTNKILELLDRVEKETDTT